MYNAELLPVFIQNRVQCNTSQAKSTLYDFRVDAATWKKLFWYDMKDESAWPPLRQKVGEKKALHRFRFYPATKRHQVLLNKLSSDWPTILCSQSEGPNCIHSQNLGAWHCSWESHHGTKDGDLTTAEKKISSCFSFSLSLFSLFSSVHSFNYSFLSSIETSTYRLLSVNYLLLLV